MMAAKFSLFQDHRAVELILSSPERSTHELIGRGVPNFDSAVGDRGRQNAVLSGTYARFTQNQAMKKHLLSSDNTFWLKAALWIQCGALVFGRMISEPTTHASGEEKFAR